MAQALSCQCAMDFGRLRKEAGSRWSRETAVDDTRGRAIMRLSLRGNQPRHRLQLPQQASKVLRQEKTGWRAQK